MFEPQRAPALSPGHAKVRDGHSTWSTVPWGVALQPVVIGDGIGRVVDRALPPAPLVDQEVVLVDLRIRGPLEHAEVSGTVGLKNCRIVRRIPLRPGGPPRTARDVEIV